MCSENVVLIQWGIWVLVPHPNDTKNVICLWDFTLKYILDGTIGHHKAHLVAHRFSQHYDVTNIETFSLVVCLDFVFTLLSVVVNQ